MNIIEDEELKRRKAKLFSIGYESITRVRKNNKQKIVSISVGRMMGRSIKQMNLVDLSGSHLHVVHQILINPNSAMGYIASRAR